MKNFLNYAITIVCFILFASVNVDAQLKVLSDNSVAIGSTSSSSSELLVKTNNEYYAIYAQNLKTSGNRYAFRNYVGSTSTGNAYGLLSYVYQPVGATGQSRGISTYTYARGTGTVYGYYNYLYNRSGVTSTTYGSYNYITADASSTGMKIGVYSRVLGSGTKYAGYFLGNVYVSGTVLLTTPVPGTNQKLVPVANALSKLTKVNTFTTTSQANGKQKTSYSLDPTSLKQSFPELVVEVDRTKEVVPQGASEKETLANKEGNEVFENNGKNAAVDMNGLIPVMIEAIKEQQREIETLKAQIKAQ